MTRAEIANKLATFDPALTEQQRCVHEWRPLADGVTVLKCERCGMRHWPNFAGDAPLVGDGQNEERFNSLDALYALCERLRKVKKIHDWRMSSHEVGADADHWVIVSCWGEGPGIVEHEVFDDDPCLALATAIRKAMGVSTV